MAGQASNYGPIQTFIAGEAIIAGQAVKLDTTAGQVLVTTAITSDVIGHAVTTAASGEEVDVYCGAKLRVRAGGAIVLGVQVVAGATGDVETFTGVGATAKSCGIALSASAADGEFIEMLVRYGVNHPPNS